MGFDLQDFIESPSVDTLYSCRKDDMLCIAAHFNISVDKYKVKKEMREKILQKLEELKILEIPSMSTQPRAEVSIEDDRERVLATPRVDKFSPQAPPATLPRFEAFSPGSLGASSDAKLKVCLVRLQMEGQEKERRADYEHRLQIRKLEIEAEKEITLKRLEVDALRISSEQTFERSRPSHTVSHTKSFDVSKNIALVPTFRESEVDSYFCAFERIATALVWPKDMWPILLQCKLVGKAQEVVSSLSLEESLQYEVLKESILRAYELVPEAYRQKFRNHKKSATQTFVEFAREKGILFDKWCAANEVKDHFESLRQLLLLEDFKNTLPERMVIFLNEQKVTSLAKAAVLADEFMLTHKTVFSSPLRPDSASISLTGRPDLGPTTFERSRGPPSPPRGPRECNYCHKTGHLISGCHFLKRKQQFSQRFQTPKGMGLIKGVSLSDIEMSQEDDVPDPCFKPFISKGFVSLTGDPKDQLPVQVLRDTGGSQSIIREGILPLTSRSSCGSSAVVQGVGMTLVAAPLHNVYIHSSLVKGFFKVAVLPALPIKGVDFILSNDLAGGKVKPVPEVIDSPDLSLDAEKSAEVPPEIFPACVVTRAQSKKYGEDLSDYFLATGQFLEDMTVSDRLPEEARSAGAGSPSNSSELVQLPAPREEFMAAQLSDETLSKCLSSVISHEEAKSKKMAYIMEDHLLMRRWISDACEESDSVAIYQVVVPTTYRSQVMSLAHDHPWSGHMGVTKTYQRVLKHFFWPGLKSDVVLYCRTCHVCQVVGKPNQVIHPAPLIPIPVMGEPFERVIVDCVGPLPKTGNQFLLTVMCASTRFPEAIPLWKITAPVITKALLKFFSMFGLPKVVQTDQDKKLGETNYVIQTPDRRRPTRVSYQHAKEVLHQGRPK
nr:uncharacterized protein LOC117463411 [Pseudochaenichthys georgianus]